MDSYELSFEASDGKNFMIEYKEPNRFDISPRVQDYLSQYFKITK